MECDDLLVLILVVYIMFGWIVYQLIRVQNSMEDHMALADELRSVRDQLSKAKDEIVTKISNLETALAASGAQTQEVTDAVADLKAVSQVLDDVVADAPAEEAPAEDAAQ